MFRLVIDGFKDMAGDYQKQLKPKNNGVEKGQDGVLEEVGTWRECIPEIDKGNQEGVEMETNKWKIIKKQYNRKKVLKCL